MNDLEKYIIHDDKTLKEGILKIENNHSGFVLTINQNQQVTGFISDGDIRRALLVNPSLDQQMGAITNKNFLFFTEETSREEILKEFDESIKAIPVLNKNNNLVRLISRNSIPTISEKDLITHSKSPVRISFGGGGSDITHYFSKYGGAVINSTISLYTHAFMTKREDQKIFIRSHDLNSEVYADNLDDLVNQKNSFGLIASVIKSLDPDFGFNLELYSDYPMSSGLGGSAVVASSIIGCFNEFRGDRFSKKEIAELAFQAERIYSNISGGWQDQYATVYGGFNFMEFRKDNNVVHPLRLDKVTLNQLHASLVLCNTNITHDSGAIHDDQKQSTKSSKVKKIISQNVDLTYEIRNSLLDGNLDSFASCLNNAWDLKRQISHEISNSKIDKIYSNAISYGAKAGKLLGAGGGGYFIFFVDPINRQNLIQKLKEDGLDTTNFNFDFDGMQSWSVRK